MIISVIPKEESIKISIKEIKDRVKNQKYKTYSLNHVLMENKYPGVLLERFFWDYNEVLNSVIQDIWSTIEWKEYYIDKEDDLYCPYKQKRLYPYYRKDNEFKSDIKNHYLKKWKYSAHWINSVVDTAFSILDSWKKNYKKGKRHRRCPVVKRRFVRVKQSLMKIEEVEDKDGTKRDRLRISIKPRTFIYLDLSKRYFKIDGRIGEPILTPTQIHLPLENNNEVNSDETEILRKARAKAIGWDLNQFSMDGFSPETKWIKVDLKELYTVHLTYNNKRRRINKIASKKKVVGKRLKDKYSKREKNRSNQICHNITNEIKKIGIKHGFEDLNKYGMNFRKRGKKGRNWNRWINNINWKQITDQMEYKSDIELVDPYHTSKDCSRCGCTNKDLKGIKFECINKDCGLIINRQFNSSINIYLKMEGLSQKFGTGLVGSRNRTKWFDSNILGVFTQTGAERKETDELARSLYDMMKPQFYIDVNPSKYNNGLITT